MPAKVGAGVLQVNTLLSRHPQDFALPRPFSVYGWSKLKQRGASWTFLTS